jgi:hypothetical protein
VSIKDFLDLSGARGVEKVSLASSVTFTSIFEKSVSTNVVPKKQGQSQIDFYFDIQIVFLLL